LFDWVTREIAAEKHKLPQEEQGARFFYEMLCDYVHPNVASHTLVVNEVQVLNDDRISYSLAYVPDSDELLMVVLHAVSIPIKSSLTLVCNQLRSLLHTLNILKGKIDGFERAMGAANGL